ncbi:MAG: hypothetical protein ACE15C_13135 [Phycisphaerae bacterium]
MAAIESVRYHILRDPKTRLEINDDTRLNRQRNPDQYENRVAFTSLLWHPDGGLYCGCTAFNRDIFTRFDPGTEKFTSLRYQDVAEEYEVKIHRSLCLASDGTIYSATACLYTLDQRLKAPGGSIFRYFPPAWRAAGGGEAARIQKLCIPARHDYPQTITLDEERKLIYGLTQPVFRFFVYHIDTGEVEDYDYQGSITHISALDDEGCFWSTWDAVRHYLFKYDPRTRQITYFNKGIPEGAKFADIMYRGAGPVDCMINGRDGYLYIGTTGGTLCRLDPRTADVAYLGRPHPTRRLPGLALMADGRILCAGGDQEGGYLAIYDRKTNGWEHLGELVEPRTGNKLYRVHDLCLSGDGRTAYVAETDVPARSGYLWEAKLKL